jgi:coproporphyrinogen III oxidase-like Fe-S oxidoreductase
LRLVREGVGAADFEARFGIPLVKKFGQAIADGLERQLLEWLDAPAGARLRLTKAGRFLANQAVMLFMP